MPSRRFADLFESGSGQVRKPLARAQRDWIFEQRKGGYPFHVFLFPFGFFAARSCPASASILCFGQRFYDGYSKNIAVRIPFSSTKVRFRA
jgi:hypothetical protein